MLAVLERSVLGKDRKEKVVKLAGQLTALRSQLDELVDHIEQEHKEVEAYSWSV